MVDIEDVPRERLADEEWVRTLAGAGMVDGERWVQDILRHLKTPVCHAAVVYGGNSKDWRYVACRNPVASGQRHCPIHGGKRFRKRHWNPGRRLRRAWRAFWR